MSLLLQRMVDGLTDGSIYALLALGLVVVFRSSGHLHLAHGEVGLAGAYVAWTVADRVGPAGLALLGAISAGALVSVLVRVVVIAPIERRGQQSSLAAGFGVLLAVHAAVQAVWDPSVVRRLPSVFPDQGNARLDARTDVVRFAGAHVYARQIGAVVVVVVASALLWALMANTRTGLAMRAVSTDPESARLAGVRVERSVTLGWAIAGALSAIAACLLGSEVLLSPSPMFVPMAMASVAVLIAGLDSAPGAVATAVGIGVARSVLGGYVAWIGTDLFPLVGAAVAAALLMIRPTGLFGSVRVDRS